MITDKRVDIVSLFDGISCGMIAFKRAKINVNKYYAFEINKYAKAISKYNYPEIKQQGNVLSADFDKFTDIDFVIGGSPCTFWSIAKKNREVDKSGIGWELFMCFVKAIRSIKPAYFLYENVASMPKCIKEFISEELQCEPIMINSALISAQQRKRLYWTNIKSIVQPISKKIQVIDILEIYTTLNKSIGATLATCTNECGEFKHLEVRKDNKLNTLITDSLICKPIRLGLIGKEGQGNRVYSVQGKTVCLSANGGGKGAKIGLYKIDLANSSYAIRKLTPIESERCQTIPDNYTAFGIFDNGEIKVISNTQRYKCIGNAWTIDVISYILNFLEPRGSFLI